MEWSSEEIFEFLDLYEKEPVLWNPKHPLNRNRSTARDSWNRIQENFSVECSIEELKRKKDSLMAMFRPLFRRVKKSLASGNVGENVFKPTWFAYEKMAKFLTNMVESTVENDKEGEAREPYESEDSIAAEKTTEEMSFFKSNVDRVSRKRKLVNTKSRQTQTLKMSKASDADVAKNIDSKDTCTLFSELLALKLREFDEITRITVMNDIDNLIFRTKLKSLEASANDNLNLINLQVPQVSFKQEDVLEEADEF